MPEPTGTDPYHPPSDRSVTQSPPSDTEPRRVWPVYVLFVVTLIAMMLASVVVVGLAWFVVGPGGTPDPVELARLALHPGVFIASIVVTGAVLVGASLSAAALSTVPWKKRLHLIPHSHGVLPIVLAAIGLPALSVILETIVLALGLEISGNLKLITETIAKMEGVQIPLVVIAISVGPGLSEELLFRGYVQTRLTARHGIALGVAISSLLFGVMHMDPLHSVLTTFMGGYLGYLAIRFGSIWPAVAAHTLNNGVSALSVVLVLDTASSTEPDFVAATVALVVFAACWRFGVMAAKPESDGRAALPGR